LIERDSLEQQIQIVQAADRHPNSPDLTGGERVIGVVTDLSGEVECDRQTALTLP
jgi:hypothetical protein